MVCVLEGHQQNVQVQTENSTYRTRTTTGREIGRKSTATCETNEAAVQAANVPEAAAAHENADSSLTDLFRM